MIDIIEKLAYLYLNNHNINSESVENGFANYYFPSGKDQQYSKFVESWEKCISSNKNLCEHSTNACAKCIKIKEFSESTQTVVFF